MEIDRAKVHHAAKNGIPLVIRSHNLPADTRETLEKLLRTFLEELGQTGFFDLLAYGLRELADNGLRANLKRVHFQECGLDINDPEQNARGLASFAADSADTAQRYQTLLVEQDRWIKVTFLIRAETLYLNVRNNATATTLELETLRQRVAGAWRFGSIGEYFSPGPSGNEGAGLGLVTLVLILRKLGLDDRSFEFGLAGTDTSATLKIPMSRLKRETVEQITREISAAVDSIPPFPANLQNLFRLLEDPEVEFRLLADELAKDPAITADLIKYINSASARGYKRIDSLEEAIRIVGTRGLKDLMYPYGAHKILGPYLAKQRQLWDNAVQVSRYAVELAKEFRFDWNEKGQTQIVGLLYNLGQIVLTFLYPEMSLRILEFCRAKRLSIATFDALTQSVNPAALGALITEKWNFPEDLVLVLRHQNSPLEAPEALRRAAAAVCLASSLRSVELGLLQYSQFTEDWLAPLGLDPDQLPGLHERLLNTAGTLAGTRVVQS
jgi:HD-like signal output (HDOD) protein